MKYVYHGPASGVTLLGDGKEKEVMLFDGHTVDLPEAHEYTKTLLALGHLERPAAEPVTEAPVKATKKGGE